MRKKWREVRKIKETDLFEPVKNCLMRDLGCSDVYGEIDNCDVVGKRGNYDVIVEMKTSLNFKVILQAIERKNYGAYMYIAVPKPKRSSNHWQIYNEFIKPHGIGIIYVDDHVGSRDSYEKYNDDDIPYHKYKARVCYKAKINHLYINQRLRGIKQLSDGLNEWEKKNIGGSKGGETVTAYSNMINHVKDYLLKNGWSTIDEIIENVPEVSNHYKNPKASLKATLREKWNSHWTVFKRHPEKRIGLVNVKENVEEVA
ncbi:MAG: hypothetical protein ACRCXQ_01275 [Vagococcus fluvialis]